MNWNSWMVRHFWIVGLFWILWTMFADDTVLPDQVLSWPWGRVVLCVLVGCLTGPSFVAYGVFKGGGDASA